MKLISLKLSWLLFIFISCNAYGQNKKDLVLELSAKIDSLGILLQNQSEQLNTNSLKLDSLTTCIQKHDKTIDSLNSEIDSLKSHYLINHTKTDSIHKRINEYQWFTLQSFSYEERPKNVESNCTYSLTKEQFHKGQYIFMSGYEGPCAIKFENNFITLKMVPSGFMTEGNTMYVNNELNYTVIVRDLGIIETGQDLGYTGDRAYLYKLHLVDIIVITPLGNTIIFKAYGNCRA